MEKSTSRTIRLGILVLTGTLIFTVAVYLIGQKQDMFRNTFTIRAVFNNVNGLQRGNNVRFSGINVGSVMAVDIQNDSTVEVTLRIREDVRKFIRKDALVTIGTDGLMGNMLVNITPGASHADIIDDNDLLNSFSRIKTDDILKTLNMTNENAAMLTRSLLDITEEIQHGKGTLSYLVYDTTLRMQLYQSIRNLRLATEKTNSLLSDVQLMTADINAGKGLAGYLLRDSSTIMQLERTMHNLQSAALEINKSTDSLQIFIQKLNTGKGAIPTLWQDTTLVNDLRSTLKNLNQGTQKFDENMEAMKHSFLTRKYFKEQEKEAKKSTPKN
ncbi:MAG: MCE family protein [Cyclobacteriaceae bacterium]|nr:MCE family protein [Cyclobacteriaceae bacterium]